MAVQIQFRRDQAAQWTSVNPTLAEGEFGLELDTGNIKMGNGLSGWTSLPYFAPGATASVTSNEVSVVSNAVSVEGVARSVKDNLLSAAIVAADLHASVASAAATSADGHANTVSARLVSASAELVSLIQIASLAATSADNHANTASAAATAADAHANTVSARLVSASAELVSLIQIASLAATSVNSRVTSVNSFLAAISARASGSSVKGLQSAIDAVSATLVDTEAALQGNIDNVSTAAGAADAHANTVSARLVSASAELVSLIQIASAAATSVNNRVTSVNTFLGALSVRSVGDVSTKGLQSVLDALSNRISAVVGGAASATSQEISVLVQAASLAATSVNNRVTSVNTFLGNISARNQGGTSVKGLQSAIDQVSTALSAVWEGLSGALAQTNTEVAGIHACAAASARDVADQSVRGFQSVFDALSDRISAMGGGPGGGSVTSAEVQTVSDNASLANVSLSAVIKADIASVSAAIKADIGSVSAAIMADAASHLASTSATIKADIASVSAAIKADIGSVSTVIKADIGSVSAAIIANVAAQFGTGQFRVVTGGTQAVATAVFTPVSGLSVSIGGSGIYRVDGQLIWSQSGAGSASAIFNFGFSITAQPTMAMFKMHGNIQQLVAAGALSSWCTFAGNSAICATPSIMYSAKPSPGTSGSVTNTMFFEGVLVASTAGANLQPCVACSTGAFGIALQPGCWMRAVKIG